MKVFHDDKEWLWPESQTLKRCLQLIIKFVHNELKSSSYQVVCKLYDKLKKVFPSLGDRPKSLFTIKEDYHDQCFEGNKYSRLVHGTSGPDERHAAEELQSFHDCFVLFRNVMYACFGFTLDALYHKKLTNFAACVEGLNLSVTAITTKVHVIVRCVPEFIAKHQKTLVHFCEQVIKQCHSKFDELFTQD